MRVVSVENLKSDMELAKPIVDGGTYLLTAGQSNLTRYESRLKQLGIEYVYVKDEFSYDIEVDQVISNETRRKGQKLVEDIFEELSKKEKIDINNARNYVTGLIDEIMSAEDVLLNLMDVKSTDNYTFEHSVNVTVISLLIAKSMDLRRKDLEKLGLGAITHDVGKINIPRDILKKPDRLTEKEYDIIKEHPRLGYERLKEGSQMSSTSMAVVLGHHENYCGDGYPRGVSREKIHLYPRIVSVADVFDALTSNRVYRDRWTVKEAVDFIYFKSGEKFDPEVVKHFSRYVTLYPNGIQVKLSDGREAIVVEQNENFPERPVVRILDDSKEEIDLSQKLDLVIEDELID